MIQTVNASAGKGIAGHDALTVAAIAAISALVVIVDHEALGHGSVCLAVGGQITLLSSSLFRCSVPSALIDIGGSAMSLTLGLIALIASRIVSRTRPGLRLGLMLIAAFAGFWEGGYLVQAMATQKGDLYFVGANFIGEPSLWWRIAGGVLGLALYLATVVVTARGLASLGEGRRIGRTAWVAATLVTVVTAIVYRGGLGENLLNAFLEIGLASLPLLLLMPTSSSPLTERAIRRQWGIVIAAVLVAIAFVGTQGLGIGDPGLA